MSELKVPAAKQSGWQSVLGFVLSLLVLCIFGVACWQAVLDSESPRTVVLVLSGGCIFVQVLCFIKKISWLTQGIVSFSYLLVAICGAAVIAPVPKHFVAIVLGVSLGDIAFVHALIGLCIGALAMPSLADSKRGRITSAVIAVVALLPWGLGIATGLTIFEVLSGSGTFYSTWAWYVQPGLIGGAVLIVALFLTGVSVTLEYKHKDKILFVFAILLVPISVGTIVGRYTLYVRDNGVPTSTNDDAPQIESPKKPSIGTHAADGPPEAEVPGEIDVSDSPGVPDESEASTAKAPEPVLACVPEVFSSRDIGELETAFAADSWRKSAIAALEVRYPDAAWMVGTLRDSDNFDVWFAGGTDSWQSVMRSLEVGVHEASHMVDLQNPRRSKHSFVVAQDEVVTIKVPTTFERSNIADELPDEIRALSYTKVYLEGEGSEQGFEMVLEELNAYTWGLLTSVAFVDQMPSNMSTSSIDGVLTFMYYVEVYLDLAEREHGKVYRKLTENKVMRSAILRLWDRAACVVKRAEQHEQLGIDDDKLRPYVFGEQSLGQIESLRQMP